MNFLTTLSDSKALMTVAVIVVSLTILVFLLSSIVFFHHIASDRQRRRNRQRFEGAAQYLATHLVSNDARLSDRVVEARHQFGDRAVSLVLRRARYDIRGEGANAISAILADMGSIAELSKQARHRKDWIRANGIRGLGECGGFEARAILAEAANDQSGEVRRAAREGLLADGSPEAIQVAITSFLIDLPRRAGWRRSFYARLATAAAPELLTLITTDRLSAPEQKLAIEALADAGARNALPLAVSKLSSKDPELRATGARALGKLGTIAELPLLISSLGDQEWYVRAAAARGIEWMLSSEGVQMNGSAGKATSALGTKLTDNSWWVRANAARALARAGQPGVETLLRNAEGRDNYARDAALAALAMATLTDEQKKRATQIALRDSHPPAAAPGFGGIEG